MNRKKIGARLQQVREQSGLGRATACEKVGIGTTTLRQWEVGATEVSLETLEQLARLYKVSPQYLIFGTDGDTPTPIPIRSANDDYDYFPCYDQAVSAGAGTLALDKDNATQLAFPKWWSRQRGLNAKHLCGLNTKGDSMQPTIPDGSLLIVDTSKTHPMDGKIYVVRIDTELFVKRLQRIPIAGGIEFISDNTDYSPFKLSKQELEQDGLFQVIGQVVHIGIDLPH